jgi:hypothetical protein
VRCEQVPGASQFFLNYVITAALGALALELSGVVKIVILAIKTTVRATAIHTVLQYSVCIVLYTAALLEHSLHSMSDSSSADAYNIDCLYTEYSTLH